jgi:hypothetical protein
LDPLTQSGPCCEPKQNNNKIGFGSQQGPNWTI